jgi:EmrB/QacA subfamily drug resistance transporter
MSATAVFSTPLGEVLDRRQKWLLLISLMLCMFVSALDQTIVATATPRMLADLGGFSLLSWVFTVYLLSSTVVVPLVGKLSDMFGRKLFLIAGVALFVTASAGCGAAMNMPELIAARAIQGAGGGMIFSCVFATLGDLFPPAERGKYIGLFTGTFSLAAITGPTIGGLLTDHAGWRWCFYVNVPVGMLAILFIWQNLPFSKKGGLLSRIDFVGSFLLSGATIALLLALVWAQSSYGWSGFETISLFAVSAVLLVAFGFQESRHPEPIFPLALFRNRPFVMANAIVLLLGAGMFGAIQYLPTFVQTSLGASATASGLVTTPQSLGLLFTSIIGGQILARTGRYRYMTIAGGVLILGATLALRTLDVGEPEWHISAYMVAYGLGFGLVMPTLSVVTQNAVAHQYLGVATSARQFSMQIGQVLGTAIFGVVLATVYSSSFADHVSREATAEIPPATLARFDDPTLALDARKFGAVRAEILALPGGDRLLASTMEAQKAGVAEAIQYIFLGSSVVAVGALALLLAMKEVPLRRQFGSAPGEAPAGMTAPAIEV